MCMLLHTETNCVMAYFAALSVFRVKTIMVF